jgi:hypothetical protein
MQTQLATIAIIIAIVITTAMPAFAAEPATPGFGPFASVARRGKLKNAAAHHKGLSLGGADFVSVVTYGELLDQTALIAIRRQGKRWKRLWKFVLKRPIDTMGEDRSQLSSCNVHAEKEERVRPKVHLRVLDVDKDGKLEAIIRVADCIIHRAVGDATERRLYIVNLGMKRTLALKADLDYATISWSARGRETFVDTNKDGHPDVTIRRRSTTEASKQTTISRKTYIWRPKSDSYRLPKKR